MSVVGRRPAGPAAWAVIGLGIILLIAGLVLLVGGVQLGTLGGSWYYAIAGIGLLGAAAGLIYRSALGAWIYIATFLLTLVWAIWEVGLDPWPLLPRLLGPWLIVLAVVAAFAVVGGVRGRAMAWTGAVVWVAASALAGVVIAQATPARVAGPMPSRLPPMHDPSPRQAGSDWPAYGGTYAAQRYSPLAQITRENVGRLRRAWVYETGDTPAENYGAETTPLKVGDTLYLCTSRNILVALEAGSGREIWRFDPKVSNEYIPYTAACRGVAYYDVPQAPADALCAARIFEGTLDARLIAVDARTGRPCPDFGIGGGVKITTGMGEVVPGMVSITSPPAIVRGVVVTGHQVLDGQRRDAPSGVIQGFDAVTGALRWAWDLGRPGRTGLPPPGETYTRGTPNMWTTLTGDEELGLVYLPMGNSAVDYWSGTRSPREDEFTASIVAVDVTTGQPRWHFRTVNVDVWDYDLGSQPTLVDFPTSGDPVPALILASKQGEFYVFDRRDGRLLHGVEQRPAPQGGVEPERRAATQPFSLYHSVRMPDLEERDMWGMSPIDQMLCRIQFRLADYRGVYTPPTADRYWIQYPGYNGGVDWGSIAVDPVRGVIVANYNDMPNHNRLIPRAVADRLGWAPRSQARGGGMLTGPEGAGDPQAGTPYAIHVNAGWRMPVTQLLCKEPPYGGIRAIELATGRTIWDRPLGTARRNGPFGIPSYLPFNIGTPNNGGSVVTAGGLIFIAAATDNLIRAIDIETGETLWQDVLPAGGQANPMMFASGGRQFLVIMAGGHHFMETPPGDELIAYALPPG